MLWHGVDNVDALSVPLSDGCRTLAPTRSIAPFLGELMSYQTCHLSIPPCSFSMILGGSDGGADQDDTDDVDRDDTDDVHRLVLDDTVDAKNGHTLPRAEVEVSGKKIDLSIHVSSPLFCLPVCNCMLFSTFLTSSQSSEMR